MHAGLHSESNRVLYKVGKESGTEHAPVIPQCYTGQIKQTRHRVENYCISWHAFHEYFTVSSSPVAYDDPAACSGRTPPNAYYHAQTDVDKTC